MIRRGLRVLIGGRTSANAYDWRALLADLEGAYAPATLKANSGDFAAFERWCAGRGEAPLPASPELVAAFITEMGATSAVLTLRRRLHVIKRMHQWFKLADPTGEEAVQLAWRRALKRQAKPPRQALGLSAELRDELLAASPETLVGLRDRAMIAVGYDTLCRRSELVSLLLEDIAVLPKAGAKVLIRQAKNDPAGEGRYAYLSRGALQALQAWVAAAGLTTGPLFRPIHRGDRVGAGAMNPRIVNRTLQLAAERAGVDPAIVRRLSGHSMRVGAAQDLAIAGRSVLQIMRAGRWYSLGGMMGYVRKADVNVWGALGDSLPAADAAEAP